MSKGFCAMRVAVSAEQMGVSHPEPTVAAWVNNYSTKYADMKAWLTVAERHIADAAEQGASIFVFPEMVSFAWLCFAPRECIVPSSKKWEAEQGAIFVAAMKEAAKKYNMLIVAGTFLAQIEDGSWRNRAHILLPNGTAQVQDKLHLMPDERREAGLQAGDVIRLVEWDGLKIAIVICLDNQMPAGALALLEGGQPDLVLAPSMTAKHSGYNRVFTCAAARAVELHCPVVVVGGVGGFNYRDEDETNVCGASLFIPCETVFGMNGKREAIGPFAEMEEADGLLFVAKDVPAHACHQAREQNLCEAWYLPNHLKAVEVAA